jgi:hypothetical protein
MLLQILLNVLLIIFEVHAHRNHDLVAEKELRKRYLNGLQNKALEQCTAKLKSSGLEAKIVSRRQTLAGRLRKRDLHGHDGKIILVATSTGPTNCRPIPSSPRSSNGPRKKSPLQIQLQHVHSGLGDIWRESFSTVAKITRRTLLYIHCSRDGYAWLTIHRCYRRLHQKGCTRNSDGCSALCRSPIHRYDHMRTRQ